MKTFKFSLRIPEGLHQQLLELSSESGVSMNAEIIKRLESSLNETNAVSEETTRRIAREEIEKALSKK